MMGRASCFLFNFLLALGSIASQIPAALAGILITVDQLMD